MDANPDCSMCNGAGSILHPSMGLVPCPECWSKPDPPPAPPALTKTTVLEGAKYFEGSLHYDGKPGHRHWLGLSHLLPDELVVLPYERHTDKGKKRYRVTVVVTAVPEEP